MDGLLAGGRRTRRGAIVALLGLAGWGRVALADVGGGEDRVATLRAAEEAFAATMARRDLEAFAACIAEDAVFINGGKPLRGKAAIVAEWAKFFEGSEAPFSWTPEIAEVSGSGDLGYTEGPVQGADGSVRIRFFSTWRREADGGWKVVFDNGYRVCPPA